ncbi:MAG: hypothetical protein QXW80_02235 [Candidatus Micrarchaeia archaeon]
MKKYNKKVFTNETKELNFRIITFFLLAFSSIIFAQTSGPAQEFNKVWTSSEFPWQLIALIAVSISFLFAALAYMFSKIFQSSDLEKFAKYEFLYALSTLLLAVFIVAIVDVLASKSGEFVFLLSKNINIAGSEKLTEYISQKGYSPFSVADFYLASLNKLAIKRYQDVFCIAYPFFVFTGVDKKEDVETQSKIGSIFKGISSFFVGNTFTSQLTIIPFRAFLTSLNRAMSNLSYLIYSLYFQLHLLSFIQQTMLTVFLPIGIVLRGFPFVRSIGNMFISIALGLYFVYPITFSLFLTMGIQGSSQVTFLETSGTMQLSCIQDLVTNIPSLPVKITSMIIKISGEGISAIATEINDSVNALIGELFVFGFIFPVLSLVITYTFIKSFGIILNADIQEFAEGLVKLI